MMSPERRGELQATRLRLAQELQSLVENQPPDDGSKKAQRAIRDWQFACASLQGLIGKLDKATSLPPERRPAEVPAQVEPLSSTAIARIPKGRRAEMRVTVNEWKGVRNLDVRLWYLPKGGGEWAPSRKGVAVEAGKIDALVNALLLAKQHVVST